jgi:signal transduction histidine kinase
LLIIGPLKCCWIKRDEKISRLWNDASLERLSQLINQLLELSKLQKGMMELKREYISAVYAIHCFIFYVLPMNGVFFKH